MVDCELIGVMKRYGEVIALDDVSFSVARGEFVTLLGPSGCGKTSTLRVIAGFLRPDRGRVLLRGEVVDDVPIYERDIGMVFQNYALFPHMTVGDNVAFGLRMRRVAAGEIGTRVREALQLVRLDGFESRDPDALSGGQQQRVAIARALVIRPSLLLLDEPMSNLDAALRASMQLELRQIVQRVGVTTINVTHNQEEALSMSDRVIVMAGGRVEQIGSPLEVYSRPRNAFVAGFVGRSNLIVCRVVASDAEGTKAKAEAGHLITMAKTDTVPGESLTVLIRPERIGLCPPGASGENCVAGRVKQVAFFGASFEYWVDVSGQDFIVHQPASADQGSPVPGDEVSLRWDAGAVVPLRGVTGREGRCSSAP